MEPKALEAITSAVAPVVMVSATGLLLMGIQTKNLHLADRIRALASEYRALTGGAEAELRRREIREQLVQFDRRIRLNQRALELLYVAIVAFVLTSLLLAATSWLGAGPAFAVVALLFVAGVTFVVVALVVEFLEMAAGLQTLGLEMQRIVGRD